MINLIAALPAEAKPLIRAFDLQRRQPDGDFPLYTSRELCLTLCGPGIQSMKRAVRFLLAQQSTSVDLWINMGIAGHGSLERGRCLLADSVILEESGEHWELSPIPMETIDYSPLHCVTQPASTYAEGCAYDMESAGFTATLADAGLLHQAQILKVVSDNPRQPSTEINGKLVSTLIERAIPTLSQLMDRF